MYTHARTLHSRGRIAGQYQARANDSSPSSVTGINASPIVIIAAILLCIDFFNHKDTKSTKILSVFVSLWFSSNSQKDCRPFYADQSAGQAQIYPDQYCGKN